MPPAKRPTGDLATPKFATKTAARATAAAARATTVEGIGPAIAADLRQIIIDERDDKLAFALARGEKSCEAMCEFAGHFVTHPYEAYRLLERKQRDKDFMARVIEWRERLARDASVLAAMADQKEALDKEWALTNLRRVVRMAMGDEPIIQPVIMPRTKGESGPPKVEHVKVRKTDLRTAYSSIAVISEMLGILDEPGDGNLDEEVAAALASIDTSARTH